MAPSYLRQSGVSRNDSSEDVALPLVFAVPDDRGRERPVLVQCPLSPEAVPLGFPERDDHTPLPSVQPGGAWLALAVLLGLLFWLSVAVIAALWWWFA